jgi:hypothetical protein
LHLLFDHRIFDRLRRDNASLRHDKQAAAYEEQLLDLRGRVRIDMPSAAKAEALKLGRVRSR